MKIKQLDHLVLTVKDIQTSIDFYVHTLGMEAIQFGDNRHALKFGNQKINLHQQGSELKPHALHATAGSADLCFLVEDDLSAVIEHLEKLNIKIESGPVDRTGACGKIKSVYIRDPDGNLLEISKTI